MTFTSSNLKVAYGKYGVLTLAGHQPNMPIKATVSLSSSPGLGRENTVEDSWFKIRAGRDHSAINIMGKNRLNLGKLFNLLPIK